MNKYKLLLSFLLIILMISRCVNININKKVNNNNYIDLKLSIYIEKFKNKLYEKGASEEDIPDFKAVLGEIKRENVIGTCLYKKDEPREIIVDKKYWSTIEEIKKIALIYHEAAHCLCDRHHNHAYGVYPEYISNVKMPNPKLSGLELTLSGYFEDKCPLSLMHPTLPSVECLTTHWKHYTEEMLEDCEIL